MESGGRNRGSIEHTWLPYDNLVDEFLSFIDPELGGLALTGWAHRCRRDSEVTREVFWQVFGGLGLSLAGAVTRPKGNCRKGHYLERSSKNMGEMGKLWFPKMSIWGAFENPRLTGLDAFENPRLTGLEAFENPSPSSCRMFVCFF